MMLWNWRAHSISTVLITRSQTAPALLGFIAQITTEHKGTQALPRELTGKDCVSIRLQAMEYIHYLKPSAVFLQPYHSLKVYLPVSEGTKSPIAFKLLSVVVFFKNF